MRPLTPKMKIAGPVYTVRGNKRFYDDGKDPRYKQMDMLDGIFPESIIVMDSGTKNLLLIGENNSLIYGKRSKRCHNTWWHKRY